MVLDDGVGGKYRKKRWGYDMVLETICMDIGEDMLKERFVVGIICIYVYICNMDTSYCPNVQYIESIHI